MSVKISRILHAGYHLECDKIEIVFDPIFENPFSYNCYAFPKVEFDLEALKTQRWSAVFISHYHDDHCSLESLKLLRRETPIFIYCIYDELLQMIKDLGFLHVQALKIDYPVQVGKFEVIPRRALDADVDSIFHVKAEGLNILNVVDSWIDAETLSLLAKSAPWDFVMWPFQTMREIEVISPKRAMPSDQKLPEEWSEQLKVLNPKYLVPSSCQFIHEDWSWFRKAYFPISYRSFHKQINEMLPQTSVIRINPGASIELSKSFLKDSTELCWIKPIGDQDVDYQYDPDFVPPSTADIAKHIMALESRESDFVTEYCRSGLLTTFSSLEPSTEPYFQKSILWQLRTYDHLGNGEIFNYKLSGSKIELVEEDLRLSSLGWLTEIPKAKLYNALVEGESLSSIYIRVNDKTLSSEFEKKIIPVDPIEDPLIRCLFTKEFGSYQAAQLKRIKMQTKD